MSKFLANEAIQKLYTRVVVPEIPRDLTCGISFWTIAGCKALTLMKLDLVTKIYLKT